MARRNGLSDAPGLRRAVFSTSTRRLGALSIVLALSGSGIVAAAAAQAAPTTAPPTTSPTSTAPRPTSPTSTTPPTPTTPPTTVVLLPPPPPFPLGDDFGRLLPGRRRDALVALAASNAGIATAGALVSVSSEHLRTARRVQVHAREHALDVARQLVSIHDQIKVLAADAYMLGSSVQITGALSSFASAKDVIGLSRNLTLVHSSNDRLMDLVDIERREQARAAAQVRAAAKGLGQAERAWHAAASGLAGAQARRVAAVADLDQVERDQIRFFSLATTSASPIMGPSRLTADDLVAYIDSLHLHPQLTVPLRTLADLYISEGNAEGVRGDVAFAQSILETGAFMFPGHGLVDPGDNNFAGIDACDSCKHGDLFESALIGVRAQMQLLRIYADPTVQTIADLASPLALLHEPLLGFSGHVQTWYALGGRWATGPNYGFHIYDIYMNMVSLAARR